MMGWHHCFWASGVAEAHGGGVPTGGSPDSQELVMFYLFNLDLPKRC